MTTTLEFVRRAVTDRNDAAVRRIWRSHCNAYRLVHSVPTVRGLPAQWRAERLVNGVWDILSRHRTRAGAERSCREAARREVAHA